MLSNAPKERKGGAQADPQYFRYAGAGMQFALTFLAFGAIGYWLDGKLGTTPWLLLIGIALGATGAFISLVRKVQPARDSARKDGSGGPTEPMILIRLGNLLALAAACALAWRLGGAMGWGVLAGFGAGAGLTGAGVCWQQRLLRRGSSFVMQAFGISFLVKLICVVGGALLLRFSDGADGIGALVDWRGYLIAFSVAVVWVGSLGSVGTMRVLRTGSA